MVYPAGSAWRRWLITCSTTPILGASTRACLSLLKRGPYYGRHRVGLLTRGRPPQKSTTAIHRSPGGPGRTVRDRGSAALMAVCGLGRRGLRAADEPHGAPAHEIPKCGRLASSLGKQGRGRARASSLFQEVEQLPLAGGASEVGVGCGTDRRPLYGRPPRRGGDQLDPTVGFGRAERFGTEGALQCRPGDNIVRLPVTSRDRLKYADSGPFPGRAAVRRAARLVGGRRRSSQTRRQTSTWSGGRERSSATTIVLVARVDLSANLSTPRGGAPESGRRPR
jgi:hypothetical protein